MAAENAVFVLAKDGTRLAPTFNRKKVRTYLRTGKAKIECYRPFFTIRLTYTPKNVSTPEIEACFDTGEQHIGLSVKSEKHEYISEQRDNLPDEKEAHDAQRKTRRARRNRKRYRKPRFDNRRKEKGWIAPSLRHAVDNHEYLLRELVKVCPVTSVRIEGGSFDTQALAAIEAGEPLPQGEDYQKGPRYKFDTLREAVFFRDGYKCLCCGESAITDDVILHVHHLGFRKKDHSDRMENLATVCTGCHTSAAHHEGGVLWDFEPDIKPLNGAAFMNTVRWIMFNEMGEIAKANNAAIHMAYGAATKRTRLNRNIRKSHANDAYCIGNFHPRHRTRTKFYKKRRRNNRCLQKFTDARYIDIRDGTEKAGGQLGCNRTKRKVPRNNEKNLRKFRGPKISKGVAPIRRQRYEIRPGDPLRYKDRVIISAGVHNKGKDVTYKGSKIFPVESIFPAKTKKGEDIPIEKGNMCMYISKQGKQKKARILDVDTNANTVTVRWTYSVPVDQVKQLRYTGGWERYVPESLYIY